MIQLRNRLFVGGLFRRRFFELLVILFFFFLFVIKAAVGQN